LKKILFFPFQPSTGTSLALSPFFFPASAQLPLPFPPFGLPRAAAWPALLGLLRSAFPRGPLGLICSAAHQCGPPADAPHWPARPSAPQPSPAPRSARLSAPAAPLPFLSLCSWPARQPPRAHSAARALLSLHHGSRLSEPPPSTFLLPRCPFPFSARRWRSPKRQATAAVSPARQAPACPAPLPCTPRRPPAYKNPSRAPVFSLSRPLEAHTHRRRSSAVPVPRTSPPTTS